MSAIFIDDTSRKLFIEGLVEVLSEIFSVESDEQRVSLEKELTGLSDEELVKKQELVESYADTLLKLKNDHQIKIEMTANSLVEKEERANTSLDLNFS